jgi:hypothetical protein
MQSLPFLRTRDATTHLLVFVHGFTGGPNTFINKTREHLCDLLSPEIQDACDVAEYHYGSTILQFPKAAAMLHRIPFLGNHLRKRINRTIEEHGSLLVTHYENNLPKYRQIGFLCHSMGGLVAKHAVIKILQKHGAFRGFYITLATPHRGVQEAALLSDIVSIQARALAPLSATISRLDEQWGKVQGSVRAQYYCALEDDVVQEISCAPRGAKDEATKVEGTHCEICKPLQKQSAIVRHLNSTLGKYLGLPIAPTCRIKRRSAIR